MVFHNELKRFLMILLTVSVVFSAISAHAAKYADMADDELLKEYYEIQQEVFSRQMKAENNTLILDRNGVQVYVGGSIRIDKEYSWSTSYSVFLPIVVVNNTNKTIDPYFDDASVNVWSTKIKETIDGVAPGKKGKGEVIFNLENTDVVTAMDIKQFEFTVRVYDSHDFFGEQIVERTEPITLTVSGVSRK